MTTLYLEVKVGNFDPVNQQQRHFETLFQEVHTQTIICYFAMAYFTRRMDNINFHTKIAWLMISFQELLTWP